MSDPMLQPDRAPTPSPVDDAETTVTTTSPEFPTTDRSPRPRSRRRTTVLVVLAVLALAVPAWAATSYRDVPDSYVHSANIERLRTAGVTAGCRDGSVYCPNDPVTRGSMASFVGRAGGTAVSGSSSTTLAAGSGNVNGVPVNLAVTGPGVAGTQQVVLQGSVTVHHSGALADCPCEVEAFVYRARDSAQGASSWTVLSGQAAAGSGMASVSLPVTWQTTITSGRRDEFRVAVFVGGTRVGGVRAEGTLTAVTAPFRG